jgi:hypothetical protein
MAAFFALVVLLAAAAEFAIAFVSPVGFVCLVEDAREGGD